MSALKVLIVDDHQYNRDLLTFILEDHNYDSCQASNGQEAITALSNDPDIGMVLMDVNMPVMDGREATRVIKKTFKNRFIPIVFVTAIGEDQVLAECLEAGGDDFISKPVNEIVLLAKVAAHSRTAVIYQQLQETNKSLSFHKRIMEREHAIVDHVFQNGMKRVDTQCDNLKFHISPMSMFNGDLLLASPSPSGGLYLMLGDFTGHGLSAAIGCLPVADIFYAMTSKQTSIADLASELNHKLQELLPSNMFFCAAILELSANGDRLTYWVGGMNDLLMIGPRGGVVERLQAQHMPLGVLDDREFDAAVDVINPTAGLRLLIYTDGIIESQNAAGEMFGEQRLEDLLSEPAPSYVDVVSNAIYDYREGGEQTDDMSMAELLCGPVVHAQVPLFNSRADAKNINGLPWCLSISLTPFEFSQSDIVPQVIRLLAGNNSLRSHLDVLFTLLSELIGNALEHGILHLDSEMKNSTQGFERYYQLRKDRLAQVREGSIDVSLRLMGLSLNKLELVVTDSGSGFDYEAVAVEKQAKYENSFGRGIELADSLCESLSYSNNGRTATAVYRLD